MLLHFPRGLVKGFGCFCCDKVAKEKNVDMRKECEFGSVPKHFVQFNCGCCSSVSSCVSIRTTSSAKGQAARINEGDTDTQVVINNNNKWGQCQMEGYSSLYCHVMSVVVEFVRGRWRG